MSSLTNAARSLPASRRIKRVLRSTLALDLVNWLTASDRVAIMLYHGFCKGSERDRRFPKLLPIDMFEEHLKIFERYGRPCSLEELAAGADRGIVVTFDDGYANNYELAFPVLEKHRFPATIFLTTGFLDRTTPLWGDWLDFLATAARPANTAPDWDGTIRSLKAFLRTLPPDRIHAFLCRMQEHLQVRYDWAVMPEQLQPLRWQDVRAMRRSGLVTLGAHTVSHPVLSRCDATVQRSEVIDSKQRLEEELGEPCFAFAYPYGKPDDYTGVTKQIVQQAGFTFALSADSGNNRPSSWDPYELRRWGADLSTDELSFLVSGGTVLTRSLKQVWRHATWRGAHQQRTPQ